jgi:hypothetical protein
MYYRHNEEYRLIEKSTEELQGDNVVTYWEDLNLNLYDVVVGFIQEDTREMLRHTKILKPAEMVADYVKGLEERQVNAELEIDYRLSMIELGLA